MRTQHQTLFGGASSLPSLRGNCWTTCIANLLGLPIGAVPHFVEAETDEEADRWAVEWAAERGLRLLSFPWPAPPGWAHVRFIATGRSRFGMHCVLWQDGRTLHDPLRGGAGLIGDPEWLSVFLIEDGDLFREKTRVG